MVPFLPSLITGGAGVLGGVVDAVSTGIQNRKAREFAQHQYDQQRQHSLQDWAMQNAYNAPIAQMDRLKKAGLNPNLVYGSGSAQAQSQSPRGSSAQSWRPQQLGLGSALSQAAQSAVGMYYDAQLKTLQLQVLDTNMKFTEEKMKKMQDEIDLLRATTRNRDASTGKILFDTWKGRTLFPTEFEQKQLNLKKTSADTAYTEQRIEFTKAHQQYLIDKNIREDKFLKQQLINMASQNELTRENIQKVLSETFKTQVEFGLLEQYGEREKEAALKLLDDRLKLLDEEIKRSGVLTDFQKAEKVIGLIKEIVGIVSSMMGAAGGAARTIMGIIPK